MSEVVLFFLCRSTQVLDLGARPFLLGLRDLTEVFDILSQLGVRVLGESPRYFKLCLHHLLDSVLALFELTSQGLTEIVYLLLDRRVRFRLEIFQISLLFGDFLIRPLVRMVRLFEAIL